MKPNFALLRQDFPMLQRQMHGHPLIYFDSAATAQKPQIVIDAITNFYTEHYATVHRAVYELASHSTLAYNSARHKVKEFLNAAKEEEIIFTRGTTESINLVAHCFGKAFVRPGDEIVISAIEHHSNIVPWQIMCEELGAVLKVIPVDDRGDLQLEALPALLNSKTRLVAVAHVSNALGTLNPVKEIIAMAHQVGAKVLIDGAQSAPHMRIDVQDMDADFFVFSGHKLYGPTGIGVLYGKSHLLNAMPPYQGGGDMVDIVTFEKTTYNELPLKFEAGTPMIAEAIALGTAIDYLESIGLDHILAYENELLAYATEQMEAIEHLRIVGTAREKGAIISFVIPGIHTLDMGTLLDLRGIAVRSGKLCAQPVMQRFCVPATTRASFAFYNTKAEIDLFVEAVVQSIKRLT